MAKAKLEYIWLDGYKPTQSLRGKTLIVDDFSGNLEDCPMWSFDGSSTNQAEGGSSDCLLKPVAIYPDPDRKNGYLIIFNFNKNKEYKNEVIRHKDKEIYTVWT